MENMVGIISAIASAVAAVASVVIAVLFGILQKNQAENSQKIALFDKRYDIYRTSVDIFEIIRFSSIEDSDVTIPNYLVIANMVIESYDLLKDKKFLVEHLRLNSVLQTASKKEREQADRDLFYLDWDANNQLLQLRNKILAQIKPAKFCFNEEIYDSLKRTIEEFFYYILLFRGGSAVEKERDATLLKKYIAEIADKKVFEQMESYLEIAKS